MAVHGGSGKLLLISLTRRGPVPLAEQIAARIREMIGTGALGPGDRIPSSRALAQDLRVARNTVTAAFQYLLAEGFIDTRRGGSVRVSLEPPVMNLSAGPLPGLRTQGRSPLAAGPHLAPLLALTESAPPLVSVRSVPRPFRPSVPAMDLFPVDLWGRLLSRTWRRASLQVLGYGEPLGHAPLRESVAQYLRVSRGVICSPDQVVITQGSQQAIDMACRVLMSPGDLAWVEDPGYLWARAALVNAGARIHSAPVDQEGMTVPTDPGANPARLAMVTPTRQLPLGVQMSLGRRMQLLQAAAATGMAILEDDYDAALSFSDHPLPSLFALDPHGLVLHAGSFSKMLYPALRLGYLILPLELTGSFAAIRRISDYQPPILEQATLDLFIREGHLDRHVRRMRTRYAARHRMLLDLLRRHGAGLLEPQEAAGGMNIVVWLPPGVSDQECARLAVAAGVDVLPLSSLTIQRRLRPGLLLGFSGLREDELETGVKALVQALGRRPPVRPQHEK